MSLRDPPALVVTPLNAIVLLWDQLGSLAARPAAPPVVTCRAPVPSALTTQMFRRPPRFDENAICVPSGDQVGPSSRTPSPLVIWTRLVPSRFATSMWMSPLESSPEYATFDPSGESRLAAVRRNDLRRSEPVSVAQTHGGVRGRDRRALQRRESHSPPGPVASLGAPAFATCGGGASLAAPP